MYVGKLSQVCHSAFEGIEIIRRMHCVEQYNLEITIFTMLYIIGLGMHSLYICIFNYALNANTLQQWFVKGFTYIVELMNLA